MRLSTVAAMLVVVLQLLHFHHQSKVHSLATPSDHDFSYMKFLYEATDAPLKKEYDYIIVGGGTAGCPLAATLSANYSVLVLERGSTPSAYSSVLREEEYVTALQQEDDGKTPGERFVSEDGVANVRARILGGSSMINLGFYSRAEEDFYEKSGIDWDMNLVHDAYEWVESSLVFRPNNLTVWQSALRDGLVEAGIGPYNGFDLNHVQGTKLSGSTFDNSGRRHGAVELLNRGNPRNLQVVVHATVERIVFLSDESGLAAQGVVYSDSNMKSHQTIIRGNGEIILSAGAIGSPQLLLLSGVGSESYLSSLNIPVVHPQPYTGQFMYDNPRNFINIIPPFQIEPSSAKIVGITRRFYVQAISSLPIRNTPPFSLFPHPSSSLETNSTFAHICVKIPSVLSHGSLTLKSSSDVRIAPNVKFNYFENSADLAKCVIAMKEVGDFLKTESLKPFKAHQDLAGIEGFKFLGQPLPMNETDGDSFEKLCRATTATYWHYHGGCLVGKVVDDNWRVMGINGLRVVDGSTFTSSPATNPQATVMMLGRYVGAKMLKERAAHKEG